MGKNDEELDNNEKGCCRNGNSPNINFIPKLFADEGKQCYVTCSLDSISEFSLVLSAGTGYTAGKNLRTFGNELSESCNIFVIDVFNFFSAEYANFLSSAVCSVLACGSLFSIHD